MCSQPNICFGAQTRFIFRAITSMFTSSSRAEAKPAICRPLIYFAPHLLASQPSLPHFKTNRSPNQPYCCSPGISQVKPLILKLIPTSRPYHNCYQRRNSHAFLPCSGFVLMPEMALSQSRRAALYSWLHIFIHYLKFGHLLIASGLSPKI